MEFDEVGLRGRPNNPFDALEVIRNIAEAALPPDGLDPHDALGRIVAVLELHPAARRLDPSTLDV